MDINNYYTYQESEFVKNAYRSLRKSFKDERQRSKASTGNYYTRN